MVVIRPTAALAKRMKAKLASTNTKSKTILGDWYAVDLVLDRKQYILCVSEKARLPVILHAAPYVSFPERLAPALGEVLLGIKIPFVKIQAELNFTSEVDLAKTESRSVLGSMNECRHALQYLVDDRRFKHDTLKTSLWLADHISLILPDRTPSDTVLKLFGEPLPVRSYRPNLSLVPHEE
jgi:hypothetical protein